MRKYQINFSIKQKTQNQIKKQTTELKNEQNKTLINNHDILKECHKYYQNLYKNKNKKTVI